MQRKSYRILMYLNYSHRSYQSVDVSKCIGDVDYLCSLVIFNGIFNVMPCILQRGLATSY